MKDAIYIISCLTLSCSSCLATPLYNCIALRKDLCCPEHVHLRLLTLLAVMGMSKIAIFYNIIPCLSSNLCISSDFIGAFSWLIENVSLMCPYLMVGKYIGLVSADLITNAIGIP